MVRECVSHAAVASTRHAVMGLKRCGCFDVAGLGSSLMASPHYSEVVVLSASPCLPECLPSSVDSSYDSDGSLPLCFYYLWPTLRSFTTLSSAAESIIQYLRALQ